MESIIFNNKKYIGRKQIVLDCKFSIDSANAVGSVLSIQAKPIILNARCEDGKVLFGGKLDTSFIYIAQNGQKLCLVNVSEFTQSYENSEISSGDEAHLECKVVDITTPSVKTNEVKVACIVDVSVSVIKHSEVATQINCENEVTKQQDISIMKLSQMLSGSFDVVEEVKIDGSVSKVLKVEVHTVLRDVQCNAGFVSLDLAVFTSTIYVDDFDNICVHKQTFDVKQEVESNSSTPESVAQINVVPLNYLTKSVVTQGDGFNTIKVQIPVQYSGEVYNSACESIVQDAYSLSQITQIEASNMDYIALNKNAYFENSCHGEVAFEETNAEVVCVLTASAEVTNHMLDGTKIQAEGVISATVLCKSITTSTAEDGSEVEVAELNPVRADYGFTCTLSADSFLGCEFGSLYCDVLDVDAALLDKTLGITTKLGFWAHGQMQNSCPVILSVNSIGDREQKTCAMEVLISEEKQDLWSLCKNAGVQQEEVLKQNPQINNTVEKGSKIFVYYKMHADK